MTEIWKPCKHYEDLYEISTLGRVRNINTKQIKQQFTNYNKKTGKGGYPIISVDRGKWHKMEYVHRLVALTFVPNPEGKPCVNHIDTVITNNEVTNLEWCTHKENNMNPLTREKANKFLKSEEFRKMNSERMLGDKNPANTHRESNIFVKQSKKVQCIETGKIYSSAKEASVDVGLSEFYVAHRGNGRGKEIFTAGGYHWKYID